MSISQLICERCGGVREEIRRGRSATLRASGPVAPVPTTFSVADYQAARGAMARGVRGVTPETLATIARGLPEPPDSWGKRGANVYAAAKADRRTGDDLIWNPPNPWAAR